MLQTMERRVMVGFVVGVLLGGLGMWLAQPAPETVPPSPMDEPGDVADTPGDGAQPALNPASGATTPPSAAGEAAPAAPAAVEPAPKDGTTADALLRARTESIRKAAAMQIERLQQQERHAEDIARHQLAAEAAKEAARLADIERGGLLQLIEKLDDEWVAPQSLLTSSERFGAFFERKAQGATLDVGRANASPQDVEAGDTIRVAAGSWPLDTRKLTRSRRGGGFPHDLVIEGVGMDKSLVILNDEFDISSQVVNLTFRDVTIHCNDNYFTYFRRGFTLRLERCRVIGFDMGAGGSTAFNGKDGALFATDCHIEAGFGRAPYRGNLWRVRGVFLARLERCTIVGPIDDLEPRGNEGLIVYDNCRFVDVEDRERKQLESHKGVRLLDCRFEVRDDLTKKRRARKARDVSEITPTWEIPENWR